MSENKITEISRLMSSPNNLREDIREAINIIGSHFRGKYISPIEQEIKICSDECRKTPTKEAVLLDACRPFVKKSEVLDNMIDIINSISVIQRLMPNSVNAMSIVDSSIHDDGIYDVDKSCSAAEMQSASVSGINPIVIALIILLADAG